MGYTFTGHTKDWIQRNIYYLGAWEPNLSAWTRSTLSPGDVFIDVGANIGYFTLLAANIVGTSGQVIAIEPMPDTFACLAHHVRINALDNVRLINEAAYGPGEQQIVTLYLAADHNIGGTSMAPRWDSSESRTAQVVARPLASMLSVDECRRARLIKIDVEGVEVEAVSGLGLERDIFRPDLELVVEVLSELPKERERAGQLIDYMRVLGFYPYVLRDTHRLRDYVSTAYLKRPVRLISPLQRAENVVFSRRNATVL
jgi:FkbM family methyltransferase